MFALMIILTMTVSGSGKLTIEGDLYKTLAACQSAGVEATNWLTQDFVKVTYQCEKVAPK